MLGASAQSSEAAPKPAIPRRNTRRRPKRSATPLATASIPASATRKPSSTHCSSPSVAFRSREIAGSATLTIVMSTALITIAAQTTASPRQRIAGSQARLSSIPLTPPG